MAEAVAVTDGSERTPQVRLRPDWKSRLLNELFATFVALLFLLAGALVLLDSAPGHRFIIDRLSDFETASGLKIRIGRIDGSIFGKSQLRNIAISDQPVSYTHLVRVEGDSMSPTLNAGDDILVDLEDSGERLRDGIYVLRVDDALLVKRLALNPVGRRLTVQSDNPAYPDWPDCDFDQVQFIGRVIWSGRRIV